MAYYIGVDGGGTKTVYALFDENRNLLCEVKGPGTNHENMEGSFDEASQKLWKGLCELVGTHGIALNNVSFILMGLAGIDHKFQHDIMCAKLEEMGLRNFEIFNDGFIVVKAGSETGAAIGFNMGTGVCCNAIDKSGNMLQLAGLGDYSGDTGGGHFIARTAFKLIYDDVYLHIRETVLTKKFFDDFGIKTRDEFLASVAILDDEEKAEHMIMRLLDFFFEAAQEGDEAVMEATRELAVRGAQFICAHANYLDFDDTVEVVLSGSIHTKLPSEIYVNMLMEECRLRSKRTLEFKKLRCAPVTGCINWIAQKYM